MPGKVIPAVWTVPLVGFRRPARLNERAAWVRAASVAIRQAGIPRLPDAAVEVHYAPRHGPGNHLSHHNRFDGGALERCTAHCIAGAVLAGVVPSDSRAHIIGLPPVIERPTGEPGRFWLVISTPRPLESTA